MFTLKVDDIHIHLHTADSDAILRRLSELLTETQILKAGIVKVLAQGDRLLMSSAETNAVLDQIDAFTNQLAEQLTAVAVAQSGQSEKLTEIGNDLDDLIKNTDDPAIKLRLEAHRDTLANAASVAQNAATSANQTSTTLTELAAKHDSPIPELPAPPVEG